MHTLDESYVGGIGRVISSVDTIFNSCGKKLQYGRNDGSKRKARDGFRLQVVFWFDSTPTTYSSNTRTAIQRETTQVSCPNTKRKKKHVYTSETDPRDSREEIQKKLVRPSGDPLWHARFHPTARAKRQHSVQGWHAYVSTSFLSRDYGSCYIFPRPWWYCTLHLLLSVLSRWSTRLRTLMGASSSFFTATPPDRATVGS